MMPSTGPQIESSGSVFELVATARGHELTIYLDRADTNVPVDGATIEITTDGKPPLAAKPIGAGTYEAEATWLDEPGAKPLVFTVMAGEEADLLNGVLQVSQPAGASAEQHSLMELLAQPVSWLLIAGGVIAGIRRRAVLAACVTRGNLLAFCGRCARVRDTASGRGA